MFTPRPIGFVSSPYKDASEVPKGLGAKHEADGVLKILPEFELGLTDIEGFSHLIVIWEFDRSPKLELHGHRNELHGSRIDRHAALRQSAAWCVCDPIAATSEPDWPDYRRAAPPRRHRAACAG